MYSFYTTGTGVDAVRSTTEVAAAGVEHWLKYQVWVDARCDTLLSTGAIDHGTVFKLSDCLPFCETDAECSAVEFSYLQSTCITYVTCIGELLTSEYSVYGSVGFLESFLHRPHEVECAQRCYLRVDRLSARQRLSGLLRRLRPCRRHGGHDRAGLPGHGLLQVALPVQRGLPGRGLLKVALPVQRRLHRLHIRDLRGAILGL